MEVTSEEVITLLQRTHEYALAEAACGWFVLNLETDLEVTRIGVQALAATPGTRFHRQNEPRMKAREAFVRVANSDALRRAELRQVRPHRGPWKPGMYGFYYDGANKEPGPNNWRGIARVIGLRVPIQFGSPIEVFF